MNLSQSDVLRGDIWLVNFHEPRGDIIRGKRPAIIVSVNKQNRSSGIVTVVPLTSALKRPMSCHVCICGYGLHKESTALAEQITSIPKTWLIHRLGSLIESEKMNELEQAMVRQLDVA